ncbi:MAG: thioesterase family protein [Acidimicrobiia bacterium]
MKPLSPGLTGSFDGTVANTDSAIALGSGSVPVLATPRLIAWLEAAAVEALMGTIPDGYTSVGTLIEMQHLAATPIGGAVTAVATVVAVDEKTVEFDLQATDDRAVIATGRHVRAIVNETRFLARL